MKGNWLCFASIIIAVGVMRSHLTTAQMDCPRKVEVRCKMKSYYRSHQPQVGNKDLLKVQVGTGNQTNIAFVGSQSDSKDHTEFLMKICGSIPVTRDWVIRCNFNLSYYISVKAGNIELEKASSETDDQRFRRRPLPLPGHIFTFRSVSTNKFVASDSTGQVLLKRPTHPTKDRTTYLKFVNCTRLP